MTLCRATALLSLLLFTPAAAAEVDASDLARSIESYVGPLVDAGHLSGVLLVAEGDRVVYERAWGMADYELGVPNTPATRFNVASVTKPMTQIAAVTLIGNGVLSGDDPVGKWIPGFPKGEVITLEMLLRHRAGIPHRLTEPHDEIVPRTAADMVELAKKAPFDFEPGTSDNYSSGGYAVIARILELAAKKPYEEVLEELVFGPAGAVHSLHPAGRGLIANRAQSYYQGGDGPFPADLKNLSFLVGAGSVFSTARDLFLIQRALVTGSYGEDVRETLVGDRNPRWNGYTNGYRAFVDTDRETDVTVAFVGNVFNGSGNLLRAAVPKLAAGEDVAPAVIPEIEVIAMTPAQMRALEGDFDLGGDPTAFRFLSPDLAMFGTWVMIPVGESRFFSPQDYAIVEVTRDAAGNVKALDWGGGVVFQKIDD